MPLSLFQPLCLIVLAIAYSYVFRTSPRPKDTALNILLLMITGLVGENTCIAFYHFYSYSDAWWLKIGHVPIIIPMIWPMVILSAGQVVTALWPKRRVAQKALFVGLAVVFDASLMEVNAVAADYWIWAEPGYLQVPVIGILGWGFFAAASVVFRDAAAKPSLGWLSWAWPVPTLAATHVLILAAWWGCFRWVLRGDLGVAARIGFCILAAGVVVAAQRRRKRYRLGVEVVVPRVLASLAFLVLLVSLSGLPVAPWLWLHVLAVAIPYIMISDFAAIRASALALRQ